MATTIEPTGHVQNPSDVSQNTNQIVRDTSQKPLKPKHQLFVDAYILTKNAAESARRAGYLGRNSDVMGSKLLKHPLIRKEVDRILNYQLEASKTKVVEQLERDITRESYLTLVQNAYDEVGPKHGNAPSYLTIIAKVKGFFVDMIQNNMLVNINDPEMNSSVLSSASSLARRIERINKAQQSGDKSA